MNRDDIRKLVGGYATGTLTEAERALLFEAALDDQDLFDELAGEHALKEMLDEPGVRGRLAASLVPPSVSVPLKWWMRPWPVSALGAAALGILVTVAALRAPETREIAAVINAPASDAIAFKDAVPQAREAAERVAPRVNAPPPAPAPAPAPAKPAPQVVGALASPEELKKDAGNAIAAPEQRKAEVPPAQANESDRKERALADAAQQQAKQQSQQQGQQIQNQQGQQQPLQQTPQQQTPAAPPSQEHVTVTATQSVVEAEQRRDQAVGRGGAAQIPQTPPAAAKAPALARQKAATFATANALPAFSWTIENGVLRVTPARDGVLRMEAAPRAPTVVANARRGVAAEFAIPADAASVRVSFSAPNVSVDALDRAGNLRAGSRTAGSVSMPTGAPSGPVSIEIPLR